MASKAPTETHEVPTEMDYAEHEATWRAFTAMVKWGIIGGAILAVFLYIVVRP